MKKKVTLSLDADIYEKFQKYCEENAVMLSKKIELWIKDYLKSERFRETKLSNQKRAGSGGG